jgi:Poxvirus Late Transcription Factor VLTF3 like/TFIIB zinc-binding
MSSSYVIDVKYIDDLIKENIPKEYLSAYIERTKDIMEQYKILNVKRKIYFVKPTNNPENDVCDSLDEQYISRAMMFFDYLSPQLREALIEKARHLKRLQVSIDKCVECGSSNLTNDKETGSIICSDCGLESKEFVDSSFAYKDSASMSIMKRPPYERSKHFKDLVNQFQGKPTRVVDTKVIEELINECHKNGVEPCNVTRSNIYKFLMEINRREYYDMINYFYGYLTKTPLPDLSAIESKLYEDYDKLQQAYNELSFEERQGRNNFLKGTQIFERLLKKYNIPYDEDSFIQLKTDDRIRKYDAILERLFKKLEWTFR